MNTYRIETVDGNELIIETNANEKQWEKVMLWLNANVGKFTKANIKRELKTYEHVLEIKIR